MFIFQMDAYVNSPGRDRGSGFRLNVPKKQRHIRFCIMPVFRLPHFCIKHL